MSNAWKRDKISKLCSMIVDCVNRTAPIVDGITPYRMIRTTNVRHGKIDLSECRYVDEATFDRWTRRAEVIDGDVILTREAPIGEVGLIRGHGKVFLGQRLMQFRASLDKIDPQFLFYSFLAPDLQHQFGTHEGSGSVVSHIRVADCHNFQVSYPPLPEQRAISATLGALDDKIELNRTMNATLEVMARALFRDWFVDFGPTRAKMAGEALSPDLWSLFPDRLDPEGKPEGWEAGTLNDLATLNPESWTARNAPEKVAYVDLANTKWGSIDNIEPFDWKDAPSRAKRILRPGDTIVGTVRPGNGSFTYIGEDGLTGSTGFAVLRPNSLRDRAFVWCAATSSENIDRLTHLADGGAYPAVRPEAVASTEIVVPDVKTLDAFCHAVAENLALIEANKAESRTLAQTRDLLLPRLMSGELRIAEAKRMLEEVA